MSRTAAISFEGNEYEVDPALVGCTVELRFRPEDLFAIEVWFGGRQVGWAEPRRIARHVHRSAPPPVPEPAPTPIAPRRDPISASPRRPRGPHGRPDRVP